MSIPTPHQVGNTLDALEDLVPEMRSRYKDAYEYSLDRPDHRGAHKDSNRHGGRNPVAASDPTGEIVGAQERTRERLRWAGRKIDHLKKDAKAVVVELEGILAGKEDEFESLDETLSKRRSTVNDDKHKKDLLEAQAARRRREIHEEITRHESALVDLKRQLRGVAS